MPTNANDHSNNAQGSTRRKKRRADDIEKQSDGIRKKRVSNQRSPKKPAAAKKVVTRKESSPRSAKKPPPRKSPSRKSPRQVSARKSPQRAHAAVVSEQPQPTRSNPRNTSRNGSAQGQSAARTGTAPLISEAEKGYLTSILQKVKTNGGDMLSEIQSQILGLPDPPTTSSDGLPEVDGHPNKNSGKRPSGAVRRSAAQRAQDDEDNDGMLDDPHDDEDSQNDSDLNDDNGYDEILDVMDDDDATGAPTRGESDEEQDVILHVEDAENDDCRPEVDVDREAEDATVHDRDPITNDDNNTSSQLGNQVRAHEGSSSASPSSVDTSGFVNIVTSLKKDLFSHIDNSISQMRTEIRADLEEAKKLRDHLTEMTSIVTTTACAVFIKNQSSNPRTKDIQTKLCLLNGLFDDSFLLKVIPKVVVGFFVTNADEGSEYRALEAKGVDYFTVSYFAIQPHERKNAKFSSHVGRIYSKLRYSLSMSSLLAMQKNSFNRFHNDKLKALVVDPSNISTEETSSLNPTSRILQPFWLKPGYVTSEHCVTAANKQEKCGNSEATEENQSAADPSQTNDDIESVDVQESSQSSGKPKSSRSGPLSRDEIATEAACMLYRRITSVLKRAREASKIQLFHDVMYIFANWAHNEATIDQSSLQVSWEQPLTMNLDDFEGVARTKTVRANDRQSVISHEMDEVDLHNIEQLEKLISGHPELSLKVEHDVLVNGTVRRIRYRINLLEVSAKWLAAYTTLQSASKARYALRADRRSLKSIMIVSFGLRKLMDRAIADHTSTKSVPWRNNFPTGVKRGRPKRFKTRSVNLDLTQLPNYVFDNINGFSLDKLLPAPSKQKEILNPMILNLTTEEFNAKVHTINGTVVNGECDDYERTALGVQHSAIQADESQGIFDI